MTDIRDHLASQMFGIPVSQVTPAQRQLTDEYMNKWAKEFVKHRDYGRLIRYCLIVGFLIILLAMFGVL